MEKIYIITIVICLFTYVQAFAFSCSELEGGMIGGACSIKELNNVQYKKTQKTFWNGFSFKEKDLRPARSNHQSRNFIDECPLGLCLYSKILESK